jgi:uncharacterized protein YlxW (UPF0749 family)
MMTGGQLMVVLIIAVVMIASVMKARMGIRKDKEGNEFFERPNSGEAQRLREEVKQLKERLAVLERITVEKENSLAREIEQLRDR